MGTIKLWGSSHIHGGPFPCLKLLLVFICSSLAATRTLSHRNEKIQHRVIPSMNCGAVKSICSYKMPNGTLEPAAQPDSDGQRVREALSGLQM